jgi:single-strand DNA-binding protein
MDLNRVLFIGNLTRDPETRTIASTGNQVTSFAIAVNDRSRGKDKEEVMYLKVETWGKTAEIAAKYLQKGSGVLVEGRLKLEEYESRDGVKRRDPVVVADRLSLGSRPTGDREGDGGAPRSDYSSQPSRSAEPRRSAPPAEPRTPRYDDFDKGNGGGGGGTEDDLPF